MSFEEWKKKRQQPGATTPAPAPVAPTTTAPTTTTPQPVSGPSGSFDEFKKRKTAGTIAPTDYDKIYKTSPETNTVTPVPEEVKQEMGFGRKAKSAALGFIASGTRALANTGTAIKSTGKEMQVDTGIRTPGKYQQVAEETILGKGAKPARELLNRALESEPGRKVVGAVGKGAEYLGGGMEKAYGDTSEAIRNRPDFIKEQSDFRGEDGNFSGAKFMDPGVYMQVIAEGLGSFIPGAAVGIATKSPVAAGATMGLAEKGDAVTEYTQKIADKRGVSVDQLSDQELVQADTIANYYGAASAVLETAFPGLMAKILKGGGRSRILNILEAVPTEGGTEGLQRFTQNFLAKVSGIDENQALGEGVLDEAIAGALMGTAIATPAAIINEPGQQTPSPAPVQQQEPPKEVKPEPVNPLPVLNKPTNTKIGELFSAFENEDDQTFREVASGLSRSELQEAKRTIGAIKEDPEATEEDQVRLTLLEDFIDTNLDVNEENIKSEASRVISGGTREAEAPALTISDKKKVKSQIETVLSAASDEEQSAIRERMATELDTDTIPGYNDLKDLVNENNPFIEATDTDQLQELYDEALQTVDQRDQELKDQKDALLAQKKQETNQSARKEVQKQIDAIDEQRRDLNGERKVYEEQALAKLADVQQSTVNQIKELEPGFDLADAVDENWEPADYTTYLNKLKKDNEQRTKEAQSNQGAVPRTKQVAKREPERVAADTKKSPESTGGDTGTGGVQPGERSSERQQLEISKKDLAGKMGIPFVDMTQKEEERTVPQTAEEVATDMIRTYVERGDTLKSLKDGQLGVSGPGAYSASIGGFIDGKKVSSDFIIVTQINGKELKEPVKVSLKKTFDAIKGPKAKEPTKEEIEALVNSKDTFTEEEMAIIEGYEGAGAKRTGGRGILDEFYTPKEVVEAVWKLITPFVGPLQQKTGDLQVLEPSAGTGRFIELGHEYGMTYTGYETNPVSAKIAKIRNPKATIVQEPFETVFIDEKGKAKKFTPKYDIVVGNPPYGTHRGKYKGLGEEKKISRYEEYFIKRSLDLTKEGGYVAMVLPSSFMRSGMTYAKGEIGKLATFIDAYRLPNGIFKGTEVGTDIVIFKRGIGDKGPSAYEITEDKWFTENPDKVLGTATTKQGRHGEEPYVEGELTDALSRIAVDREVATEIATEEVEQAEEQVELEHALPIPETGKLSEYKKIYHATDAVFTEFIPSLNPDEMGTWFAPSKDLIESPEYPIIMERFIKKDLKLISETELSKLEDTDWYMDQPDAETALLTKGYRGIEYSDGVLQLLMPNEDTFTEEQITIEPEVKAIQEEAEAILKKPAKQLEGKRSEKKAYMIVPDKKDTVQIITQGTTDQEQVYLYEKTLEDGSIDPKADFDKTKANYENGKYYTDFNYYQGNISEKLAQLERDKDSMTQAQYDRQKKGLEAVMPKRITVEEITILPIDEITKTKFGEKTMRQMFVDWLGSLPYNSFEGLNRWQISEYVDGRVVNVGDKLRNREIKKKRREVGNRLFKKFYREELDQKYQKQIEDMFNDRYNSFVRPDYSQYPFSVELNSTFYGKELNLRPIQVEGASFLVNKGVGLLAYEVGVGKTLAGAAAISEVMRRGWAKKPLVIVPKNLRAKWIKDLSEAIPNLRINDLGNLGADLKYKGKWEDFKIEEGSLSIITEEGFKRLSFTEETYQKLTGDLQDTMYSQKSKSKRAQAAANEKGEEIMGMAKRGTDFPITFEDLGFDHITIDEAHREKNVFASADTKKISGDGKSNEYGAIRGAVSERGLKAYLATQYVLQQNNGRNVFLLTATPFNNTPIEIYSMLSLMAKKRLEDMGIRNVNQFISMYVELESRLAIKANGQVLEIDQVRKFQNLQQLQRLVSEYIDFRSGEEAGISRPQKIRRKPSVKMNELQAELVEKAQDLFNDKDAGTLKAINELQKITLSPALSQYSDRNIYDMKPEEVVESSPKIKYAVEAILKAHKAEPSAAQIIFAEKGVEVFDPIKKYLVSKKKYKAEEIAILDGSVPDAKRSDIQERFQNGKVRILMTTIKEGIDLQKLSTDMYNLYLPWNPTDLLQIEGRTWRQGSYFDKVRIHYPLLENSIDSFMFQKLEEKAARLESVFSYKGNELDVSDIDFEAVKFELITDPVRRVEAEMAYKVGQIDKKIALLQSEVAYSLRKVDKVYSLQERMRDYEQYMKDADTPEDRKYWGDRLANEKKDLEEERTRLRRNGIEVDKIEETAKEKQEELAKAETEKANILAEKELRIEEAKQTPFEILYGETDYNQLTEDMSNTDFYQEMKYQRMTPRELHLMNQYGGDRVNEAIFINGRPQTIAIGSENSVTSEEALKIFRRFFSESEYKIGEEMRLFAEDGGAVWGLTTPEMVQFVTNPKESTIYHEVVHAYIKKYLTTAQWSELMGEVKEKAGRPTMSTHEAEEMLADQFIYYVKAKENNIPTTFTQKVKAVFDRIIEYLKRFAGKEDKINAFYEAIMEQKRPGFIQNLKLILDRNNVMSRADIKYQEMTPEEQERMRRRQLVMNAFQKVYGEQKPPALGKMIEEDFVNKERRTMIKAEKLEAITETVTEFALDEGRTIGALEAEANMIASQNEQIKELKLQMEQEGYEKREALRTKLGEVGYERMQAISRLVKKVERLSEKNLKQKEKINERIAKLKELQKEKIAEVKEKGKEKVKNVREQEREKADYRVKGARSKAKQREKRIEQIKKDIYAYTKDNLPRARWAKFLTIMKGAKTARALENAMFLVDEEVKEVQRASAVKNIKRILKNVEKLPIQYQMLIHSLTNGINWQGTLPKTIEKLNKINAYLDKNPEQKKNFSYRTLRRLGIPELTPFKDLTAEQLISLNAKIENIARIGLTVGIAKKANLVRTHNEKMALIQDGSTNLDVFQQSGLTQEERDAITIKQKLIDKGQTISFETKPMDFFFQYQLDGGNENGVHYGFVKKPIDQAYNQYLRTSNEIKNKVYSFLEEQKDKGIKYDPSAMDRIGLWAIKVQKGGYAKLLGSGYSKEAIEAVQLSEEEMALYAYMRQELDAMFPAIQKVYERVYNKPLEGVDDYFPFLMDWSNTSPMFQEMENQYNNKKGVSDKGFTISRVGGKNPVRVNALEVFMKHIDQATFFVAMEEELRNVKEIVKDRRYKEAVGEKAQYYVMKWLELIERKGVPYDDRTNEYFDILRKNVTLGVLAFKLTTIPIQYGALFNGAAEVGGAGILKNFPIIVTSKKAREYVINASEQMRTRVGDSPEYNEGVPGKGKFAKSVDKAREAGMWAIKKTDLQTAATVWLTAYQNYLSANDQEFSYDEVNAEAVAYADRVVRKTQSTADYKDMPPLLAQKYRSAGKALFQFQTFMLTQWAYIEKSIGHNLSKDPVKASWQATMIATNIMYVMMIRNTINAMLYGPPDDEEELAVQFAWEMVQAVPLIGNLAYGAHRVMRSPDVYTALTARTGIAMIDTGVQLLQNASMMQVSKKSDTKAKYAGKVVSNAATLAGVPGSVQMGQLWGIFVDR